jgi:histidyl-tRNA synthetase
MGIERLLALLGEVQVSVRARAADAYLVHSGESATLFAWNVAESLRGHGLSVVLHCGGGSFKSQMKRADASGARFAVIIGDEEAGRKIVSLKPMREAGEQVQVDAEQAAAMILKSNNP